mmetsp:Transcript_34814/g.63375  ORF Transcript_34814/g.63375 Transcript_34814/m.63375 type:complete len:266 (+) Transcript_34814:887-1684(+)
MTSDNHRGALLRSCLRTERGCPKPWVSMNEEYLSVAVFFEYLHNNNGFVTWTIYLGEINLDYWGDPDHYGQSFPPLGQMIGASMANLLMEPALVLSTCAADVAGSTHCGVYLWAQGTLPPPAPRMLWASPACTLVGTSFCHRLHPRGAAWQPPLAAPGPAGQQGDFGRLRQGYGPGRHPPADDDQEPSPLRTDDRIASCSPDSPATSCSFGAADGFFLRALRRRSVVVWWTDQQLLGRCCSHGQAVCRSFFCWYYNWSGPGRGAG